jgi:hypothetical protein
MFIERGVVRDDNIVRGYCPNFPRYSIDFPRRVEGVEGIKISRHVKLPDYF